MYHIVFGTCAYKASASTVRRCVGEQRERPSRPPSMAGVIANESGASATSMVPRLHAVLNHTNKPDRLGAGKIRSVKAMAQEGVCVRGALCECAIPERDESWRPA